MSSENISNNKKGEDTSKDIVSNDHNESLESEVKSSPIQCPFCSEYSADKFQSVRMHALHKHGKRLTMSDLGLKDTKKKKREPLDTPETKGLKREARRDKAEIAQRRARRDVWRERRRFDEEDDKEFERQLSLRGMGYEDFEDYLRSKKAPSELDKKLLEVIERVGAVTMIRKLSDPSESPMSNQDPQITSLQNQLLETQKEMAKLKEDAQKQELQLLREEIRELRNSPGQNSDAAIQSIRSIESLAREWIGFLKTAAGAPVIQENPPPMDTVPEEQVGILSKIPSDMVVED